MCELSIIIPVYNDQSGLNKCLRAIDDQQGVDFSLVNSVVVDNGSRPRLVLPDGLKHRVSLVRCETPGSYAARNFGVKHSSGELLAFIDADCWPHEDWLSEGLRLLKETEYSVIIGGEVTFERSERPTATELYQLMMGFGQERLIRAMGFTATANLMVSRKLFDLIGPFDDTLYSCGDREWAWRAASHGIDVVYAQNSIVSTHPRSSLSGAIIQARRVAGGRRVLGDNPDIVRKVGSARIQPAGTIAGKLRTIFRERGMSIWQRCQVLWVAVLIRLAHDGEAFRLRIGGKPERR